MRIFYLFAFAALVGGCQQDLVGFDPATNACRRFENGKYVGEFLPASRCSGMPTPEILPEDSP